VPTRDPFTFGAADRPWIDVHWLFQVMLAGVHAAGGVRGMILLAAAAGSGVILVGLAARDRRCPSWIAGACWLPALLAMSARLVPRPEIISFLAMSAYLAVLMRTDDRPALAWALPAVQVLWVNSHGLFLLGPIILGAYLVGEALDRLTPAAAVRAAGPRARRWRFWVNVGGAALAVGLACLANPYGLLGALFPLELFPKITQFGGPYKALVAEFLDLREHIKSQGLPALGGLYTRTECALLWALPLSVLIPAAWRSSRTARHDERASPLEIAAWACAFGAALFLVLASALGLPAPGSPPVLVPMARYAPLGLAVLGIAAAVLLARSSPRAALVAALGGLAEAEWVVWLKAHLMGLESAAMAWPAGLGTAASGPAAALLGIAAVILTGRTQARGSMFRLLLAVIFGYLALQAVRNIGLFGLAAGFVLTWNLGAWAAELAASWEGPGPWAAAGLVARGAVGCLVGLVIFSIGSGRFFRATAESRHLGLREAPLAYAHEAARFSARPGLPHQALVFGLRQAAVYLFHNGPQRKLFMDGRLEIPSRARFETYAALNRMLNEGRPDWVEPLRRMGDTLILLDHEDNFRAEATLLSGPEERCIYYDSIASVFVSRRRSDLEASFPTIDFAARHFHENAWRATGSLERRLGEAKALLNLKWAVGQRAGAHWSLRVSLILLAGDRLRQVLAADPAAVASWTLFGNSLWSMAEDVTAAISGPHELWDPARGLLPAQATYCYRRALESDPRAISALAQLAQAFKARRMSDALPSVEARLRSAWAAETGAREEAGAGGRLRPAGESRHERAPGWEREGLSRAVRELLQGGRPEAAVGLFAEAEGDGFAASWPASDQAALTMLHLGRPAEARRTWERAANPPSRALLLARIASADLAALDFSGAEQTYRAALELDPGLGEAWFGLALLHAERGDAAETRAAAAQGLRHSLTPAQETFMRRIGALASSPPP
jgi:tetratricopeptide (TPR) repeat protein